MEGDGNYRVKTPDKRHCDSAIILYTVVLSTWIEGGLLLDSIVYETVFRLLCISPIVKEK